jgi:tartrate dehydrogenase/decarboxylase / D-malate dehydrogenase
MPYRDERVAATAESYPDVSVDRFRIDTLAAHFVQRPQHFDVVVARNLFGDILSDLGPACIGTIGIAPSANINPTLAWPSPFEPVHGSASDIAGRGIPNPIAMVWSAALILDLLGHQDAHDRIVGAVEAMLSDTQAPRSPDIGGAAGTAHVGCALEAIVRGNSGRLSRVEAHDDTPGMRGDCE